MGGWEALLPSLDSDPSLGTLIQEEPFTKHNDWFVSCISLFPSTPRTLLGHVCVEHCLDVGTGESAPVLGEPPGWEEKVDL